jgi:long-chain fatty acid transport protein
MNSPQRCENVEQRQGSMMHDFGRNFIAAVAAAAAGVAVAGQAAAGGFALKERSARAQGLSFAGASAGSGGLQSMGFNPAAIGLVEGQGEIAGGLSGIKTIAEGDVFLGNTPIQAVDAGSNAATANLYAAYRLDPQFSLGLSVTNPFGLRTKYDRDFHGQGDALTSELITVQVSPVIAYEPVPGLTLAAQANILYADARLTSVFVGLDGDEIVPSFGVGALWEVVDGTTIGLAYDHGYDLELEGQAEGFITAGFVFPAEANAQLPGTVSLGVVHELTDDLRLMGEAQWQNWSVFDRIDIRLDRGIFGPASLQEEQDYRDAFFVAAGAEYDINDALTVRAGAAWDQTPTQDESRSARVPDEDRLWLSLGGSYNVTDSITIDAGYSFLMPLEDAVANIRNVPPQVPAGTPVRIVYDEGGAHILSIGGSIRF